MSISCCSSGSFVSTGLFRKFRLQFNESFDHMALQWIINEQELMNTCKIFGEFQKMTHLSIFHLTNDFLI